MTTSIEIRVIVVDMTPEQLEVATRHRDWHAERFGYANVKFLHGHIENLAAIGFGLFDCTPGLQGDSAETGLCC
jgi:hypothetical protein